jgi:hypothetical protein
MISENKINNINNKIKTKKRIRNTCHSINDQLK